MSLGCCSGAIARVSESCLSHLESASSPRSSRSRARTARRRRFHADLKITSVKPRTAATDIAAADA